MLDIAYIQFIIPTGAEAGVIPVKAVKSPTERTIKPRNEGGRAGFSTRPHFRWVANQGAPLAC